MLWLEFNFEFTTYWVCLLLDPPVDDKDTFWYAFESNIKNEEKKCNYKFFL